MQIKAYTFGTQAEAQAAIQTVNDGEGYPTPDGVTETYFIPQQNPTDGKWYILSDAITDKYMSNPVMITVPDLSMSGWN